MKFKNKYRFMLYKAYFEKGDSLLRYIKYFIALFGLASREILLTLLIGFAYAVTSFIAGYLFYKFGWTKAEIEVANNYNLFVKEMRRKI